jgi:hypothetical protein
MLPIRNNRNQNNNNRRNNNRKPRRPYVNIPREVSLLGVPVQRIVLSVDTITSTNAATTLTFSSTGQNYSNLTLLSTATDFANMASDFALCRIKNIQVRLSRMVSESEIFTLFPGGISPIHFNYLPTVVSTGQSVASMQANPSGLRFPLMESTTVTKTWKVPDMIIYLANGTTDFAFNPSKWWPTAYASRLGGEFSLGATIVANATATLQFLSVEIYYVMEFASPY